MNKQQQVVQNILPACDKIFSTLTGEMLTVSISHDGSPHTPAENYWVEIEGEASDEWVYGIAPNVDTSEFQATKWNPDDNSGAITMLVESSDLNEAIRAIVKDVLDTICADYNPGLRFF